MNKRNWKTTDKVKGQFLGEYEGLVVSVSPKKAKRGGRNRVWIQIRQAEPKTWRVSTSLTYARSADILFEESPKGNDAAD